MRRLLLCLSLLAAGQSKPNFSGTWLLNLESSDYSDAHFVKPDKLTWTIQQKGDHFKCRVEQAAKGRKGGYDFDVTVGGSPHESDAAGIIEMEWKGAELIVKTLYNPGQERQSDNVETWSLSSDGKRLRDDLTVHLPQNKGTVHAVRIFDKQ